ncbi:hypothetical protein PENPOL_c022G04919 [Penicillium polonicum]|uniref:SNF2 N-terminal domain-containing protein n=1 Tax=Penicillium polonicum TaxID=60169 RepID=A0A1V6N7J6_PENPO|nr:hypothetical protein PENPOL_c022G04919 [Penicillium polonicum]
MDTVPSEPEYRDLVVGLTTQLLQPTTARLNRTPLTRELHRHLSGSASADRDLVELGVGSSLCPDTSLGPHTGHAEESADDKPVPLADPAALASARDVSLDPGARPPSSYAVSPTILKPWQITGVSWMLQQEASPLHGGILADACGLGKTLTALTLTYYNIYNLLIFCQAKASKTCRKVPTKTLRGYYNRLVCLGYLFSTDAVKVLTKEEVQK